MRIPIGIIALKNRLHLEFIFNCLQLKDYSRCTVVAEQSKVTVTADWKSFEQ